VAPLRDDDTDGAGDPRLAGMLAYNQQRKKSSRENILSAAIRLFCANGYADVAIEDITAEAGVSRITYYRHFPSKAAIALELFQRAAAEGAPRMLAIGAFDYRDRPTVVRWLTDFFAADRDMQGILRVLSQANIEEADFSKQVQPFIFDLISALGKKIPAFDLDRNKPGDQRRWVEAWLLIYTILDQSNHAATRSGIAASPIMIEILADNFLVFLSKGDAAADHGARARSHARKKRVRVKQPL
jgi:AcrR family transcriptional regulator